MTDDKKDDNKKKHGPSKAEGKDDQHKEPQKPEDDLMKKLHEAEKKDEQKNEADEKKDENLKKIEELTAQLQRCMADHVNYKRRAEEDKIRFVKFANSELLKIIIPIVDNFDRSCRHLPENLKSDAWAKGVIHTHDDLMKALEKIGVKRIETVGKKLDPTKHEALLSGPGEKDIVTEELDPGYSYNDETIKPAKVKVGNGEESSSEL